jgi:hypothetical protein
MDMPSPEEMAQADAERDPANAAIHQQQQQGAKLTADDIDWKKLYEEDVKTGKAYAQGRSWNADAFVDSGFCAACSFKGDAVFHDLNVHVLKYYRDTSMETLLTQIQTMYRDKQHNDMQENDGCSVRWWFRRQIYMHLHKHNLTNAVRLEQNFRNAKDLQLQLFANITRIGLDGTTQVDSKMANAWMKLSKEVEFWAKQSDSAFQKNDRAPF